MKQAEGETSLDLVLSNTQELIHLRAGFVPLTSST